jgi:hypothetical protein
MLRLNFQDSSKLFIIYCSIAGFIAAWGISGLLVTIDLISNTPPGSFFGVIGISLGYYDPVTAQLIGFALHLLTGTIAGNMFGQISMFWKRVSPYNSRHGLKTGMIVGVTLWLILFVPLATFAIQPMMDSFNNSLSPNQYVYSLASNFNGLYYVIIIGSLAFHLIYGALLGYMSGRMTDLRAFTFHKTV